MKLLLCLIHLFLLSEFSYSQVKFDAYLETLTQSNQRREKIIDFDAIKTWKSIGRIRLISNNGQYVAYEIRNQPIGKSTLVFQSTNGNWKKEYINGTSPLFSEDSRRCIFMIQDTLYFLDLHNRSSTRYVIGVSSYIQPGTINKPPTYGGGRWVAWQEKGVNKEVTVHNLISGREYKCGNVKQYSFDEQGTCIVLQIDNGLQLLDLLTGTIKNLWSTDNKNEMIASCQIDDDGQQIAFIVSRKVENRIDNCLWYYKKGTDNAILIASNQSEGIGSNLTITQQVPTFSKNGKYIYFQLIAPPLPILSPEAANVNVWHYEDLYMKSLEIRRLEREKYTAAFNVKDKSLLQIERSKESIQAISPNGDYVVVADGQGFGDRFWIDIDLKYNLISLKDGIRYKLPLEYWYHKCWFSPDGGFFLYFKDGSYYSLNLKTKITKNISGAANVRFNEKYDYDIDREQKIPAGIGGWLANDAGVLVYDNYDVWLLDLSGKNGPICFTNGEGRKFNIKFNLLQFEKPLEGIPDKSDLLLLAFNMQTKFNGFYRKQLGTMGNPKPQTMGPYCYTMVGPNFSFGQEFDRLSIAQFPIKARDVNKWIVMRQSVEEAPNIFITSDFNKYLPISNIVPHNGYNWVTGELINWQLPNGYPSQGILYKPQNFDSSKKYPLLIGFYRRMSHRLFQYPMPQLIDDAHIVSVVTWYTSRGYLVFTPDILFTNEGMNQDAFNAVISGTKILSKRTYIDTTHMGVGGHSFAGGLTNAIISRTNMFAAAFEGAGRSDEISAGLMVGKGAFEGQSRLDVDEWNKRSSIWERPDIWVTGSAVFNANKISTPLLIFHCRNDMAMPWEQGLFLFTALRRLGKKVWMLEYEGEGHNLLQEKNKVDLAIRVTQYFDYYLKGYREPGWMNRGIMAKEKALRTGYEYGTAEVVEIIK